jgi:spore maturation protein SpmB
MAKALKVLAQVMGFSCVAIGLLHVVGGNAAIPGAESAGTTIDSLGRFFGAIFVGYGLAWLWAARQAPIPAKAVRLLAGIFLLGAAGRLLSLVTEGRPHSFQIVLLVIELVLPPVYFWLADADEKAAAKRVAGGAVGRTGAEGGAPRTTRVAP